MLAFRHSGDIGDIIYSLPLIATLGGGKFVLTDKLKPPVIREVMTADKAISLISLLGYQRYIKSVVFDPNQEQKITHDLDNFREYLTPGTSIPMAYFKMYNVDSNILHWPWLECDSKRVAYTVINRTLRYQNEKFPWQAFYAQHHRDAVFVGSDAEHIDFQNQFGPIPYYHTPTLYDLASVINGCEHFIGNQSCAFAIAAGLNKRATLEVWPTRFDCMIPHTNIAYLME